MHSNAMKFCLLPVAMLTQLMLPALSLAAPADAETATSASQLSPTTDNLYFGRGVRPRTIGLTATYRY
jgi:hypothetical protein